jgi:hypothetical protein
MSDVDTKVGGFVAPRAGAGGVLWDGGKAWMVRDGGCR